MRHTGWGVPGAGALLLAALAAACGDATGSRPAAEVSLSLVRAAAPTMGLNNTVNGVQTVIRCETTVEARATGKGRVTWTGGALLWYYGADRKTPVDSSAFSKQEITDAFGGAELAAGATQRSDWWFQAYVPFTVGLALDYVDATTGKPGRSLVHVDCGPTAPAGATAPTIEVLSVAATSAEAGVGDLVNVTFRARSPVGLWQTRVYLFGPLLDSLTFQDQLATDVTRTATFRINGGLDWGLTTLTIPLRVAIGSFDAVLKSASVSQETGIFLHDKRAPSLEGEVVLQPGGSGVSRTIAGSFKAGAPMELQIIATDDIAVDWLLYWSEGEIVMRDSVRFRDVPPRTFGDPIRRLLVPMRAEWAGKSMTFHLQARDVVGKPSTVMSSPTDGIHVVP